MDAKEILRFCIERGILLDKEVLKLIEGIGDLDSIKIFLEKIKDSTSSTIITRNLFEQNTQKVNEFFFNLPKENQEKLEKLRIKLGLSIEISKEIPKIETTTEKKILNLEGENLGNLQVDPIKISIGRKLEVSDFVKHFRNRFLSVKSVLQDHSELDNLVSINKISGNRQGISIIGIVYDKKVTKNKNILLGAEDFSGKIRVLINQNKKDLYKKAEDIALDSVIGFKGSGNSEIFFVNDIVFPESRLFERKNSPVEEYALFTGDIHFGSKKFLEKSFLKFIDYLNGKLPNTPEVSKIKYLFLVGDIVTGIGNYPNQERDLKINDLESQFEGLADLLDRIRKDIKIVISPGNHDGVRLMEPQPPLNKRYAWPLYNLKNVILTTNPAKINIGKQESFKGFDILTYHGFSFNFFANNIPKLAIEKAVNSPEKIMKFILKNRHLAPTHGSAQYFPSEEDMHFIDPIPDIFFTGHLHKSAVSYYNNILMISSSCWEGFTPYQEKFGNEPDHCKVPMLNLKTRAIKILDFEENEGN